MRRPSIAPRLVGRFGLLGLLGLFSLLGLLALPGCPEPSEENPRVLWLALDGSEIRVKLVDSEPRPF